MAARARSRIGDASMTFHLPLLGVGAPGGRTYIQKVLSYSPVVYWPLSEASGTAADNAEGTAARDAVYDSDVSGWPVTTGNGDGGTAPTFSGDDYVNIYSTSLNGVFNGQLGSLVIWFCITSDAVWTDSSNDWLLMISANLTTNYLQFWKSSAAGNLNCRYVAGSTTKNFGKTGLSGDNNWHSVGFSWSLAADEGKFYFDGVQTGATATGLGTWAGSLSSGQCVIGDNYVGAGTMFVGLLAHVAVFSAVLSSTDFVDLAGVA